MAKQKPVRRKSKTARLFGRALAAAALLALLAAAWQWNRPETLARRYQDQLAGLPDGEVDAQLRRIAELGEAGLPVLAAALGSQREAIRNSARGLLIEAVDRWELLSPAEAATKLSILAQALAKSSGQFDAANKRLAADMALRILNWPHDGSDDMGRAALMADCEAVLAVTSTSPPATLLATKSRRKKDFDVHTAGAEIDFDPPPTPASNEIAPNADDVDALPRLARFPGGGLPFELASLPPPYELPRPRTTKPAAVEPNRLPERIEGRPLNGDSADSDSTDGAPTANQPRRLPSANGEPGDVRQLNAQIDARRAADLLRPGNDGLAAWKQLALRDVMRELHSGEPRLATAAAGELERRGISGPLVALARRAGDPDPAVRRQFAESLPMLDGVDARPWLLELSYDDDPQVRATAVTLMATSGDLELLKRVRQVSLDDPDDHTRAQAEKALPNSKRRN